MRRTTRRPHRPSRRWRPTRLRMRWALWVMSAWLGLVVWVPVVVVLVQGGRHG